MYIIKNYFLALLCLFVATTISIAQIGIGLTVSNDIYQRYNNPEIEDIYGGSGSFLMNLAIGPKLWIGMEKVSLSVESQANLGIFSMALQDWKGVGAFSIPLVARLNFKGLSALNKEGDFGLFFGGGLQWNKTELYFTKSEFEDRGVDRNFFRTIVAEGGYGFGMSGFAGYGFIRYGWDPNSNANSFNFGVQLDFNLFKLKEITNPESDL